MMRSATWAGTTNHIKMSSGLSPHSATNARTLAKLDVSSTRNSMLDFPVEAIRASRAASPFSTLRQASVTLAPNAASCRADSRPMPTFAVQQVSYVRLGSR